jgi:hypothetical protein
MIYFRTPNVGKSSLFNFLGNHIFCHFFIQPTISLCIGNRPASIVNLNPGTTRDVVVLVADAAGLRETDDLHWRAARRISVSFFFGPHAQFHLRVHVASVKNADVALCVLSAVLLSWSSRTSTHINWTSSIQPLTTAHTYFLLKKCDLVTHILPPTLSTASSFFVFPHPNAK